MAKLTIEIEENEFALWDWWFYVNGDILDTGENYTSENGAYNAAVDAQKVWLWRD